MDNPAWLWPLIGGALSFGAGAYFRGYLTKKGENLATHQDIQKLDEQMRVLTTTTEKIKSEISDAVWNRQRRWELKREVVFEVTRRLAEVEEALLRLYATANSPQRPVGELVEKNKEYRNSMAALEQAVDLVALVCKDETFCAFRNAKQLVLRVVKEINNNPEIYMASQKEYVTLLRTAQTAARRELEIDLARDEKDDAAGA